MIYPTMVGIQELMEDDNFLSWVEEQDDSILNQPTIEIYSRYCSDITNTH